MTAEPAKKGILGYRLAAWVALIVAALAMASVEGAKAYPESFPRPAYLFLLTLLASAGSFALLSIKLIWLYDPEAHRRHFTMMALSVPLNYFFFTAIMGAHLAGFMPTVSWLATLLFAVTTAYGGASLAALAVIYRHKLGLRRRRGD